MKLRVYSIKKEELKTVSAPEQLLEPLRKDLITRAVTAIQSNERQAYGTNPMAGKRHSAYVSKRRRDYKTTYGIGQSRTPRKVMSRSGTRFNWVGAFAPQTVGGRRAHPPKASKIHAVDLNKKERRKAIRSALSACFDRTSVEKRGHLVPKDYPFIIETSIESQKKTKEALAILQNFGFESELVRSSRKSIRSGKGKLRGRRYKRPTGPLIVVSGPCAAKKGFANIPGIEIVQVDRLNAKLLAPGCMPGRAVIFSEKAFDRLGKEKLYTN